MADDRITIHKKWIDNYVIDLNLCPFAKLPIEKNEIQYKLTSDNLDSDELIEFLEDFCKKSNEFVSIFLIFSVNLNYLEYLDFYYEVEDLINSNDDYINLKIVGFHPDYLHGGVVEKNNPLFK